MQYEHKLWVKINIDMNVEPSISKDYFGGLNHIQANKIRLFALL